MIARIIITTSFFALTQLGNAQSTGQRNRIYTIPEVKAWAEKNQPYPTWHGWLLYQGSDTAAHHFISRVMDEWAWFTIKRSDLALKDERPYKRTSSAPLGYYYVDATRDFAKIKDYQCLN